MTFPLPLSLYYIFFISLGLVRLVSLVSFSKRTNPPRIVLFFFYTNKNVWLAIDNDKPDLLIIHSTYYRLNARPDELHPRSV